jgi:hypothetical protein
VPGSSPTSIAQTRDTNCSRSTSRICCRRSDHCDVSLLTLPTTRSPAMVGRGHGRDRILTGTFKATCVTLQSNRAASKPQRASHRPEFHAYVAPRGGDGGEIGWSAGVSLLAPVAHPTAGPPGGEPHHLSTFAMARGNDGAISGPPVSQNSPSVKTPARLWDTSSRDGP